MSQNIHDISKRRKHKLPNVPNLTCSLWKQGWMDVKFEWISNSLNAQSNRLKSYFLFYNSHDGAKSKSKEWMMCDVKRICISGSTTTVCQFNSLLVLFGVHKRPKYSVASYFIEIELHSCILMSCCSHTIGNGWWGDSIEHEIPIKRCLIVIFIIA